MNISQAFQFFTKAIPAIPIDLAIATVTDTSIAITYTSDDDVEVLYSKDNITFIAHGISESSPYTITDLEEATLYYIKIRAKRGGGYSDYTATLNRMTTGEELLVYVDGGIVNGALVDLSGDSNNVMISENLLTNGSFEGDYGWIPWAGGAPTVNERSTEQVRSGTYSRKVDLINQSGVRSLVFTTKKDDVVTYNYWIRSRAGISSVRLQWIAGNGSTVAHSVNLGNIAQNTWLNFTGQYTDTIGGVNAAVLVYITSGGRGLYLDDFSISAGGAKTVTLPINAEISDNLITKLPYYSDGNPLAVRIDAITPKVNDQVFFSTLNDSYKFLIYKNSVDAEKLYNILNWLDDEFEVYDYLTLERTIIAPKVGEHHAFHKIAFIGDKLYVAYRDGDSHTSIVAETKIADSDDNGRTWNTSQLLYDASEILTEFPQILIDDPRAEAGGQGGFFFPIDENTMRVYSGAVAGHMMLPEETEPADPENIDIRVTHSYYNTFFDIPIVNGVLDIANKTQVRYTIGTNPAENFGAGFLIEHNGVMYIGTYISTTKLWKSLDGGLTWVYVSNIVDNANEMTAQFIGERLWIVARSYDNKGVVCYSDDYGITWQGTTDILPRLDGQCSIVVDKDSSMIVFGRNLNDYLTDRPSFYKIKNGVVGTKVPIRDANYQTADNSYGTIILKDGIYYFSYHGGPLRAYPNKYDHADAGIYFKSIKQEVIDNM